MASRKTTIASTITSTRDKKVTSHARAHLVGECTGESNGELELHAGEDIGPHAVVAAPLQAGAQHGATEVAHGGIVRIPLLERRLARVARGDE